MTVTYKVLGQQNPAVTTNVDLYTAPAATQTVVSTITVCNLSAVDNAFRLAVRPANAALAAKHYINYDTKVAANDTLTITLGVTLAATDVVTVYSTLANTLSFSAFGSEITA